MLEKVNNAEMIGSLIHKVRKAQGLTQLQLAAGAGVGLRFIRELERGKESCQIGKALHIIQMLGMGVWLGN